MIQIDVCDLEIGHTYAVNHRRKGKFWATLVSFAADSEFVNLRIVSGKARYINQDDRIEGGILCVRWSFCTFSPIKEGEDE